MKPQLNCVRELERSGWLRRRWVASRTCFLVLQDQDEGHPSSIYNLTPSNSSTFTSKAKIRACAQEVGSKSGLAFSV
jgi:hypothetical protein